MNATPARRERAIYIRFNGSEPVKQYPFDKIFGFLDFHENQGENFSTELCTAAELLK